MPIYRVHIRNRDFQSTADGDHTDDKQAMREALRGVLAIGSEEVANGKAFFGAELSLALDGEIVERWMIAIGSSSLQ